MERTTRASVGACPASPTSSSCSTAGTRRETADEWDAVGLAAGDPDADVRRVLLAVDPVLPVAGEAADWDADLLVTHHPLFLRGVHGVAETTPKGRTLADPDPGRLRPAHRPHQRRPRQRRGLRRAGPRPRPARRPTGRGRAARRSTRSSSSSRSATPSAVRAALAEAGAGQIGDYDPASFTVGRRGAVPAAGRAPTRRSAASATLEVVDEAPDRGGAAPGRVGPRSSRAMLAAHPYEEVAYDVVELADPGTAATGAGRIGDVDETTLGAFADTVAQALPATARGVLVGGDPDRVVRRVAVTGGAGDFLLDRGAAPAAPTSTSPATCATTWRASSSRRAARRWSTSSHWAAEWTWLPELAARLRRGPGRYGGDPGQHALHRRVAGPPSTDPRPEPPEEPA